MKEQAQAPPSEETVRRGYELNTVSMRGLVWFLAIFVAFSAVSLVGLWYLLVGYANRDRPEDRPLSAIEMSDPRPAVPLQPRPDHDRMPGDDMRLLLRNEDRMFERIGWKVDANTHRVVIPDAAVQAVARRGGAATGPTTRPTGAGGGR